MIDTDRGVAENIRFYDTEGFSPADATGVDIPKHYHGLADAFILVYSVDSRQSFEIIDLLKKDIEKNREKKEVHRHNMHKYSFVYGCYHNAFV
jgi:NF-kappa-B inhibitor-interacting Ras-like protein